MRRNTDMTKTALEAVKGAADSITNKTAGGNLQKQISVLNNTTYSPPSPLAVLGNSTVTSGDGNDPLYPGMEKPLVSQELK